MDAVSQAMKILREKIGQMRSGKSRMPYEFIFEAEDCKKLLMAEFERLCPAGMTLAEPPQMLEDMRLAILRLSSLTIFGGFGNSFNMTIATLEEAVEDLRRHCASHSQTVE